MISRTWLALDVASGALRAAALRGRGKAVAFSGGGSRPWEGVVVPSVREPNVIDPRRFATMLRETLLPLAGRERRVALLLPDSSGRVFLTETDPLSGTREERIGILRWQLKGKFPVDSGEIRLDYQLLGKREGKRQQVLVSMASARVLDQYEELLQQAGFGAALVCFHSLGLFSYYRTRIAPGDFVLVGVEENLWSLQLFLGGTLAYYRTREIVPDPAKIFQETVRSLAGCRERFPALEQAPVFLHTDRENRDELAETLGGAFGREVADYGSRLKISVNSGSPDPRGPSIRLAACVGAAGRMMR
jgi:type IV pilus assembly protein PilM